MEYSGMETLLQPAFLMTVMNSVEGSSSSVTPQQFNTSSIESASTPVTEAGHKIKQPQTPEEYEMY